MPWVGFEPTIPTFERAKIVLIWMVAYISLELVCKKKNRPTNWWSRWGAFIQLTYSFQLHYVPGLDPASNRNEYQDFSWVKEQPARNADNLTTVCESTVQTKCGSLDVSQPYGPSLPVTGIVLPFYKARISIEIAMNLLSYCRRTWEPVQWGDDLVIRHFDFPSTSFLIVSHRRYSLMQPIIIQAVSNILQLIWSHWASTFDDSSSFQQFAADLIPLSIYLSRYKQFPTFCCWSDPIEQVLSTIQAVSNNLLLIWSHWASTFDDSSSFQHSAADLIPLSKYLWRHLYHFFIHMTFGWCSPTFTSFSCVKGWGQTVDEVSLRHQLLIRECYIRDQVRIKIPKGTYVYCPSLASYNLTVHVVTVAPILDITDHSVQGFQWLSLFFQVNIGPVPVPALVMDLSWFYSVLTCCTSILN
jgi:hypothetical protein